MLKVRYFYYFSKEYQVILILMAATAFKKAERGARKAGKISCNKKNSWRKMLQLIRLTGNRSVT